MIDLGTNGEMAIGNREGILATATAAGPAFEGGASRGIWGADMVHFAALLLQQGLMDETGLLCEPYFAKGIRIGNTLVTKEALRSLQVAKGAIQAGIQILLREYGISATQVDRVVLGGGFGYYLRPEDAVAIGMLPSDFMGRTVSGGNTALCGARAVGRMFMGGEDGLAYLPELQKNLGKVRVINLAMTEGFQEKYVGALNFAATSFE